nr:PSD1 and planctomycete cytochrome C domain-containing protein [Calycomorphotria hydatis]
MYSLRSFCALFVFSLVASSTLTAGEVDYLRDIAPIFEERCTYCHGEDESESGLRLDNRASMLRGGDSGLATIVPGMPEKSYLIDVINHVDKERAMPPDEEKIPVEEIALITRWIKEGAYWPGQMEVLADEKSDHWSFQPVRRPNVPAASTEFQNPIDAFLSQALADQGLSFSEPADPRSLIRRVSIVLTGLPPTPEEINQFLHDCEKNRDQAYLTLVDRLLQSPHFGERWAQHWLDVIRWAETNGSESNMYRKNAWIYRDYVIRAFNEDKPYDQFLYEQIAGDTVGQGDATGYLVAGPHVPSATVGREPAARRQARADRMDEILQTIGASAMGVTIGCARCHNHKFDPISIQDYYSMAAVFEGIEFGSRYPELGEDHPRRVRGKELGREIGKVQKRLRESGPWEEDWTGFLQLHFPTTAASAVRVSFDRTFLRIDELEIFGPENRWKNLAVASSGTEADGSHDVTAAASPLSRVNDGQIGNDSWICRVPPKDKRRPWVQFNFPEVRSVNRIRMSHNREDFLETDYLMGINNLNLSPYKVEVLTETGSWVEVISSQRLKKLNNKVPQRASLLQQLHELIATLNEEGPRPSFVGRFIEPAKTHVLGRGSPENPRDEVFSAGLSELGGELDLPADANGKQRREAFAEWLTAPGNPLTARVAANRLWHHVFGQGIVATTSDFGAAGASPTHPELLDWLASEFIEPTVAGNEITSPWSMKHLLRLMVTSKAFQQSSKSTQQGLATDADSAFLWRFPPKRVEAEVIRDAILQASGVLDETIGGRSYRIHNVKQRYAQWEVTDNFGAETWRRMIYQERMRRVDDGMFTAFDFPDCGQVRAKRPISTTPLQALNLMNSDFVVDQAERLANRSLQDAAGDIDAAIHNCFMLLLGRSADSDELISCREVAHEQGLSIVCRALMNSNEFAFLP